MMEITENNNVNAWAGRPFLYSDSMFSSNNDHAGTGHDVAYLFNVLYNRMMVWSDIARLQAEHITDDKVLADLIHEQILDFYGPSIIKDEEGGGMKIC